MRVTVCTMFSPSHKEMADLAVPNMVHYCNVHGYGYKIIEVADNDVWFKKHHAFQEYFKEMEEGDIIWYRDVDGLVTNMNIRVEGFAVDGYAFYLTKDFNEFNGGSVIIPNTKEGRLFNEVVLENKDMFENEQNFYNSMPMLMMGADFMKPIPHPSINSYNYSLYKECKEYVGREDLGDWRPGNLFIHFPGISPEKKLEQMNKYKDKIIYG